MAYTRRGYDWANRFASIANAAKMLPVKEAILDGEVVVLGPEGISDFGALQADLATGDSPRFVFFAFDLLFIDGYDLRQSPLRARKEALHRILDGAGGHFYFSEHFEGDGPTVQAQIRRTAPGAMRPGSKPSAGSARHS
jgi:bifunctional non-homologous end joining protein LigD